MYEEAHEVNLDAAPQRAVVSETLDDIKVQVAEMARAIKNLEPRAWDIESISKPISLERYMEIAREREVMLALNEEIQKISSSFNKSFELNRLDRAGDTPLPRRAAQLKSLQDKKEMEILARVNNPITVLIFRWLLPSREEAELEASQCIDIFNESLKRARMQVGAWRAVCLILIYIAFPLNVLWGASLARRQLARKRGRR